jgi:hypothetical protein
MPKYFNIAGFIMKNKIESSKVTHQVWQELEGETGLCFEDTRGDDFRKLLEPGAKLIYTFTAESHFDAMTIYYSFMGWGEYRTDFEIDKVLYSKQ